MKLKLDKILKNKIVLYLTFFLSLVTIFGYLVKQNYQAILFFTLVLFLTKHFSNNMIVILGVSIIATNLLDLFRVFSSSHLEGMENKEKSLDHSNVGEPSAKVKEILDNIAANYLNQGYKLYEVDNKYENVKNLKPVDIQNAKDEIKSIKKNIANLTYYDIGYLLRLVTLYIAVLAFYINDSDEKISEEDKKKYKEYINLLRELLPILEEEYKKKHDTSSKVPEHSEDYYKKEFGQATCNDSENWDSKTKKCIPKCSNEEKYDEKTQKCIANSSSKDSTSKKETMATLNPANLGEVNNPGSGNLNNFNDAKMKEMAFDNLDKIFGSDGMRSLSSDANSLNEKQNAIMGQLKDIGPLISQAMNLIKNVDMDAINSVSSKMTGMINNLQDLKSKQ